MKQKHWQVSVFDKTSETIKNDTFYTTDTEAYLIFELIDEGFTPDSATVTVYNIYGKATINASVEVADGIVRYEIPEEAIGHPGGWRTQVIFTKDNEDYTTKIIEFDVGGHLLDNKKPAIVDIENWNSFIAHAEELIDDWEQLEEIRQANEQQRELAESVRQNEFETNESTRQSEFETNETSRQASELVREEAENNRQSTFETNETERQNEFEENEQARESAESERVSNEEERISKDSERDSKIEAVEGLQADLISGAVDSAAVQQHVEERYGQLEEEYAPKLTEVTAQLAQTENRMNGVVINAMYPPVPFNSIKSDANYYDEENFKYYKDESMTVPATDNTGVVQALVNFLHEKGGGTLLIPDGKYVFRSTIAWKSKVSLIGASKTGTRLYSEGVQFSLIRGTVGNSDGSSGDDPSVWFDDCKFTDFLIDNKGLSFSEKTVDGKAIFILYMRRAIFRDLVLLNTLGTALGCDFLVDTVIDSVFTDRAGRSSYPSGHGGNSGIGIGTSALSKEPLVVTNCFTYNSGNYGVFVETQRNPSGVKAKYAKIVNCHSQGNRLGFGNKGSGGTQFIGCTAVDNRIHGFHLTQGVSGDQLLGCISEKNGGDGVRIEKDYVGDVDISNVWANENIGAGIRALINDAILKNIRILDSKTHGNGSSGVWVGGNTKNIVIKGVNSANNGQDTSISGAYKRGILVEGVNDIVSVLGGTVFDDQETKTQIVGIEVPSNTTNYIIDGNNVVGYSDTTGYQIKSDSGVIGNNGGLITEKHGVSTIPDGQSVLEVVHGFGSNPSSITLTPYDRGTVFPQVWVDRRDGNMFRIRREGSSGDLQVYWEAKV